LIMQQC